VTAGCSSSTPAIAAWWHSIRSGSHWPLGIFGEGILSPTKNTSDLFTPLTQLSEGR